MGDATVHRLHPRAAERDDDATAISRYGTALIAEAQASALDAAARGLEANPNTPTTSGEVAELLRGHATDLRDGIR